MLSRCSAGSPGARVSSFDFSERTTVMTTDQPVRAAVRLRMSQADAHYGGNLVDGARMLALFGDVATELLIRLDGDEGLFRAYSSVEFLAPVRAGDYIEAEGEITRIGNTSREMSFIARKVVAARPEISANAADLLGEPIIVCRAEGHLRDPQGVSAAGAQVMNSAVLTAAIVGAETTRAQTPHLPISAEGDRHRG